MSCRFLPSSRSTTFSDLVRVRDWVFPALPSLPTDWILHVKAASGIETPATVMLVAVAVAL